MNAKLHKISGVFILFFCVYVLSDLSELFPSLAWAAESSSLKAITGVVYVFMFPLISIVCFVMPSGLIYSVFPRLSIFVDDCKFSFSIQYVVGYISIFIFIALFVLFSTLN